VTTTLLSTRARIAALALAVALVPVAAKPADAATKKHHRHHVAKQAVKHAAAETAAPAVTLPAPAAAPAPAPAASATTSVISIGGYVFYNLTYAQAVAAYQAAVANAPAGYTPAPVTSVSATVTVGGSA
jgi:hypothetical protein